MSNLAEHVEQLEPLKRAFLALVRMQELFDQVSEKPQMLAGNAAIEEREIQRVGEIRLIDDAEIAARLSLLEQRWCSDEHRTQVQQLSLLKRALLLLEKMQEQLGRIQGGDKKAHLSHLPPLQPVSREQELPLSFTQQRLWFLDQLEPGKSIYNEYGALQLKGLLNYAALEQSIQEIVRRHESLRTIFPGVNGKASQRILPWLPLHISRVDLQDLPPAQREAAARRFAEEEVKQPFELAQGPLFRVTLFQLAEKEHLFLIIFHHIIGDGWSLGVFYRELATLYAACCHSESTPLAPLPIQYADFAAWQQRWLQGEVLEEQLAYWIKQLEGVETVLELPTDHPRPALQTNQGAMYSFKLPTALVQAIKELSQREGVTLFMTLLAAFQTLLYRYTNQEDILIGTTIANRISTELEAMIGFFANTLVLRGDLAGNPSFRGLLKRVHEMAVGAYTHQDVPFEQLVSTLHVQRDLTRSPLFQVMFVMQKASWLDAELAGLEVSSFALQRQRATFDLVLSIIEDEQDLYGTLEYSTDLFEEATIARLAGHWQMLLTQVVNQPDLPLKQLSLLTEMERQQLLVEWNTVRGDYAHAGIHEVIESQVARTPEAVAVVYKDERLTYEQLNQRANQLAHYLRKIGVGPEVLVGICIERSLEMIVGILGILKAGGAYIPLDPAYPMERLSYIIEDATAHIVLTRQPLVPLFASSPAKIVCIDTDWSEIALESSRNLASSIDSMNLAYAIYTSGSTGKPKGVLVEHAGLCSLIAAQIRDFKIGTHSRVLQFVSFSFDVSVADIFMTLCAGAMLCLVPLEDMVPGPRLLALLREYAITIARIPPAMLASMPTEELPELEVLISGGESWSSDIVARWGVGRRFVNEYGPTETTICATMAECRVDANPTIGQPLANVQTYVLDEELAPVPIGVPGQLYIGGAGVARGYLRRADITAESFIPNPFSAGARLYRTGDQVCYLPDGTLKFLGRLDEQVKVRGYRIELGEIEAVLALHARVRESIVLVREDQVGDKKLVAYVVAKGMPAPSTGELRRLLKEHLPDYMLPASFVLLDALPLNAHGKVNRRALPAPEYVRPELDEGYVAPQTTVEQKIAAVWQEVLQIERAGLQDNFFELGGHSFSMVQVHRKLQELLKPDLTLIDLFQYPTIRSLAAFLTQEQKAPAVGPNISSPGPSKQAVVSSSDIAIIGLAGRFPGASNVDEFWENLREGIESVSFFSEEELLASGVDTALLNNPRYVPANAILEDVEYFDAPFFGYSPREAEVIDPQQRLFLECAWQALEQAGYDPHTYPHAVAVYAGMSMNTYLAANLQGNPVVMGSVSDYQLVMSNSADFLATRVAYKLNLRGPAITVQTACSTSLVAVHMACESLRSGKCDMALAGGVSVRVPQRAGYVYQEGGIMSPDGHCRAFDAQAQGIVGGEGLGIVVLKRLEDAIADGDTIHAVIKGSAVNNDGSAKVGYTAPSVQGQASVITEALVLAKVAPETVGYVEAHGTGTPVGDPIEVMALRQAYATHDRSEGCALGSVKTNVGHLDAAAGIAGLIKTVQALKHQLLPPSLHYDTPNPALDLAHGPFYVNQALTPWERNGTPRRAGVSSFGVGGTNAHVILEEAATEMIPSSPSARLWHVIALSARTAPALQQAGANLAEYLRQHPDLPLADVAYTLQVGRHPFSYRSVVIGQSIEDITQVLDSSEASRLLQSVGEVTERPVVFLFPGQGAQYSGMAHDLYENEPVFRAEVDRCAELLQPLLGCDLRSVLFATGDDADERLKQTWLTQPALFVIEYALARLWMSWGVRPTALIGHSIGEYVAACLAEVFSLEEALKLVAMRGRLMQQLPAGAMLAVFLSEREARQLLNDEQLSIAAVNTATLCVVAGPISAVESFEHQLLAQSITHRRLQTSHAFHSAMMDPVLETFGNEVRSVVLRPPTLPYISNVSGTWITNEQAADPDYWVQHLRETVRFADGVQHILSNPECVLLEVGPGQTLGNFVKQHMPSEQWHLVASSLPRAKDAQADVPFILTSLGRLWLMGVSVEWSMLYQQERRQRVPLPTYPFERQRYWIERLQKAVNGYIAFDGLVESEHQVVQESVAASLHPRPLLQSAYVAPRNELELQIVDIWQQLLGIGGVGVDDNFFDLGGHSLLATQIASRLQSVFQIDLPLRSLFERLTVAELAEYIVKQLAAKRSLSATQIVAVARESYLPLSFAQQRIWLLDQLTPGNPLYNIPIGAHLYGPLETETLMKSLQAIVNRHEALRTRIRVVDGLPVQMIEPTLLPLLPIVHLQDLPAEKREDEMRRLTNEEALLPFDLGQGPLLRTRLLCLDEQHHVLLVTMHHIISDGWSMGVFFRELSALYTAFAAGQPSPLAALPVQYVDFAAWQVQWFQGSVLEEHLTYWQEQLAGDLPVLELPTDHSRPPVQTYRGAHISILLPVTLMESLKRLSQREDVTLFMTVLAAFQVLLYRYTGQTDIVVGTPIAGRNRTDIEELIGNFIGALVLRVQLEDSFTFQELLEKVREVTLGAYAHQDMPFEQLVEALQPQRDRSRSPLFQVLLRLPNVPTAPFMMGDLEVSLMPIKTAMANHDLTLDMVETADGFIAEIEYNSDLFEPETITRLLGHWQTILAAIVANPHQKLVEIPVLTLAEQQQLLVEWSTGAGHTEGHVCDAFEVQAQRTPQAVAVVFEQQRLRYAELNERANQLAHHLQRLGVGPEVMVGVSLERSIEMVVALLGILKAGGAYVPLDPTYPEERLSFMIADASVSVLITQERLRDSLAAWIACPVLCLDADWPRLSQERMENPPRISDGSHLAYMIYTSGSTGKPKGVMVAHSGLYNLVEEQKKAFVIGASDVILQFASINFDASVSEIFTALCTGARLCLGTAEALKPGRALIDIMQQHHVSLVTLPPSALAVLPVRELDGVGKIVVAGEPCSVELVRQWACGRRFINAYGPTEGTVCATVAVCDEHDTEQPAIGKPIGGVQVYVLDAHLQAVPVGVPGELFIGGAGLARGYLHRPDLTAEKFVPHPFSREAGARLYRTGDVVRYRPDGNLEFLERVDQQVKVRGFRIELGEIEAVLNQHPALQACVVVVRENVPGDKRLVAYVVVNSEAAPTVSELRGYLREWLPEYMLPGAIIMLDALPLMPNGKINRLALPAPHLLEIEVDDEYVAPRNPIEELLAAAFAELLGVKQVSIHDNFFDLGGHSLLGTQLISQIEARLQVEPPLHVLFESPTVAEFAAYVKQMLQDSQNMQIPVITPAERNGPLPLSFAQQRLWFLDQLQPGSTFYNVPGFFRLRGVIDVTLLERSLQEIVRRHEILRTTFTIMNDVPVQVIAPDAVVKLTIIPINEATLAERESEVRRLAREETLQPFDLAQGPLMRALLLQLGSDEHILLLVVHNIVSDGWSREIFIRELVTLYEAFADNMPSPLSELSIQYADFAVWQREWLQGEILEAQLTYWKQKLAGIPNRLHLPIDHPRPAIPTYQGRHQTISFPSELVEAIRDLSQREGVTLFMTLLASFQVLLSRYSGQEDIVIGSPIANRNRAVLEGLIGFFANTLVLRTDLSGDPSFQDLLARVRNMTLEAYAHQDLPFEKLVEVLQPERSLNHSPLFQVMFTVQNMSAMSEKVGWLSTESLEIETQTTKFDINVFLVDRGQELSGVLEYNSDLFDAATMVGLLEYWRTLLTAVVANPDMQIGQLPDLTYEQKQPLVIAATFTAEPLEEGLDFWMQELALPLRVQFAPYHQMFQQLLDPGSLLARNRQGINVLLIRFEDWLRDEEGTKSLLSPNYYEKVEGVIRDLGLALRAAAQRSANPFLLCVCPPSPAVTIDRQYQTAFNQLEDVLITEVEPLSNVHVVTTQELATTYPVATSYDPVGDELGHVPYTREFFGALATMIVRKVTAMRRSPYKVIAIDCDNTLWKGVCGEDGAMGVELDAPCQALQEFLVAQQEAGMLLCLCSKNNQEDVLEVFARRPEMPLQLKHLVAWRINWQAKSTNLLALAQELQLGLDSFIFIDDNPLECAEVQANCPAVLTLPLPQDRTRFPAFLGHIWAFDHLRLTEEDRQRTARYQENAARTRFQQETLSLDEFVAGLGLVVQIGPMAKQQLARVAQLTQRTNQFNCTTLRRSEAEIQQLVQENKYECLTVEVEDRFGNYGLVGAVIFTSRADTLVVDTFLLSCRVLGRGVEHEVLRRLGTIAYRHGLSRVSLAYLPTSKNQPALDFLEQVGNAFKRANKGEGWVFEFPVEVVMNTVYTPSQASLHDAADEKHSQQEKTIAMASQAMVLKIAHELATPAQVVEALSGQKRHYYNHAEPVEAPRTETERVLAELWADLLHLDQVSINANFFALGGHSLLATQLLSRIATVLQVKLPLRSLFEAPTVVLLAEQIATARQEARQSERELSGIVPVARDQKLVLSFAQQRLWFLEQLMPGNTSYNIPLQMRLQGVLDLAALRRSLNEIVRRHETLRTTFTTVDDQAVQLIAPALNLALPVIDLRSFDVAERENEAIYLAVEEGQRTFDLVHGPLIRATLLQLADEEHILLVTVHHIVFDAWSGGVLSRELMTLYEAFCAGKPSPLSALPVQYADFAAWQREWLQEDALNELAAYWRKQLSGAAPLELPTDRPQMKLRSSRGAAKSFTLPQRLTQALATLSQQEGCTLFMAMLAAFEILLHRYTGQEDIVMGTDIANRTRVETEALIGFFVNLLALRTDLGGQPNFREVLRRVREVVLGAYAHQDLPFEKLVDALQLERNLNQTPLVRALFVFQNTPMPSFEIQGLTLSPVEVEAGTTNFDLAWFMWENSQGLVGTVNYSTELFDTATITSMIQRFEVLLESILKQPDASVKTLEIYTAAEKEAFLKKEAAQRETHRRKLKIARRDEISLSDKQ